jgi:hypothetical protein
MAYAEIFLARMLPMAPVPMIPIFILWIIEAFIVQISRLAPPFCRGENAKRGMGNYINNARLKRTP